MTSQQFVGVREAKRHPSPVPQRVPTRSCILALSSKAFCTVSTPSTSVSAIPSCFRRLRVADFLAGALRAFDVRALVLRALVLRALDLRAVFFRLELVFLLVRLFAFALRALAIAVLPSFWSRH